MSTQTATAGRPGRDVGRSRPPGSRAALPVAVLGFFVITLDVAARFVQGAAAAVMMPSSMALIGQAHPAPARRAVAVWAMGGAVASSSGPVLGGLLTLVSWRLIFFINLPVGMVALILLARTQPSPRIAEKVGARLLITVGLTVMASGLTVLGLAPASTPVWQLAVLMVLVGLAGPLVMPPVTAVLLNGVPEHRAGTASGVFNTSRQLGGALAVAVFGALLADHAAFPPGVRTSLLIAAAVAVAAAAASRRLRAQRT